jgi:alpha-pyrone synthase
LARSRDRGQEEQFLTTAYVNRIATAVPEHDVHTTFVRFARTLLDERRAAVRSDGGPVADHPSLVVAEAGGRAGRPVDRRGRFFARGNFPSTADRMRQYEAAAPALAERAVNGLGLGAEELARITHVIVTTCTGLSAPGLDLELVERCGLNPSVERTVVGFMGCYAGINALKLSRHIVRSEPSARVLILSLELCTLHLQETDDLEQVLSFLVFGDGAAASLVTAEPTGHRARPVSRGAGAGDDGPHHLAYPRTRLRHVPVGPGAGRGGPWPQADVGRDIWRAASRRRSTCGRSIRAAVRCSTRSRGAGAGPGALSTSRDILDRYGNMSSATVMFVLKEMLRSRHHQGAGLRHGVRSRA